MSFLTGTLKATKIKLQTLNTFIWSRLQKYLQIILTFDNNFMFTYCTPAFHFDFFKLISALKGMLRICFNCARIY